MASDKPFSFAAADQFASAVMLLYLAALFISVVLGSEGPLSLFLQHNRDRWETLYSGLAPANVRFMEKPDGSRLAVLQDFPFQGSCKATFLHGSPLESVQDQEVIENSLVGLFDEFGGASRMAFKVLNSSRPALPQVLASHGFADVEKSTVMWVECMNDLIPQRPLPNGYTMKMVDSRQELVDIGILHGATTTWLLEKFDDSVLLDNRIKFWLVMHEGEIVCTTLIESINGVAGVHSVDTVPQHRRRGLASALVYSAVRWAFATHELKAVVLGSTPEGVSIYTRLGFKPAGHYHSYDYVRGRQHTLFLRPKDTDIFR